MKAISFLTVVLLIVGCRGCTNKYKFSTYEEKEFYTDCNGFDYIRFPLIKPYDVMCINFEKKVWYVHEQDGILSIPNTDKVYVKNGVILAYSSYTESDNHWFLIIPSKNVNLEFSEENIFEDSAQKYIPLPIEWISTQDAYDKFKHTECLPWIPGCSE